MLVLSRKHGQSILTSEGIEIKVLKQKGGDVLLGINAPKHVKIWRE